MQPHPIPVSDLKHLSSIMDLCQNSLSTVDMDKVQELERLILSSRKIFIYGSGRSGLVGQLFAVRLVQLGLDVHFVGEMTTPIIGKEDLTLLLSNTGRTSSVVQTATIARRIGSKVICITSEPESDLAKASDVSITMELPEDEDMHRIAPLGTIFENSALLLFDCVVCGIMEKEGITEEEMRQRHAIWV